MIRPLFAPYYQACMCIGLIAGLFPVAIFGLINYQSWRSTFESYSSPTMVGLWVFNSLVCGFLFLNLRQRKFEFRGPVAALCFVSLSWFEFVGLAGHRAGSFGLVELGFSAVGYVAVAALTSIAWLPLGFAVDRILERVVKRDPSLKFGRLNARTH